MFSLSEELECLVRDLIFRRLQRHEVPFSDLKNCSSQKKFMKFAEMSLKIWKYRMNK